MNWRRFLAKTRLIRRYKYLIEVDKLMEEFVQKTILDGGSAEFIGAQRQKLLGHQNNIKAQQQLVDYLRDTK